MGSTDYKHLIKQTFMFFSLITWLAKKASYRNICSAVIVVLLCHHTHNVSRIISVQHTDNHQIAMMTEVSFHVIESMIENKCADMEEEIVVQTPGNNE